MSPQSDFIYLQTKQNKNICFENDRRLKENELTGSPKKHENWKTTLGLLADILEKLKGYSIKPNM